MHAAVQGFQCSSASRKFLNDGLLLHLLRPRKFQCSSASRKFLNCPALARNRDACPVSVLFSEPKIPQCNDSRECVRPIPSFSALQRAENSSIPRAEQPQPFPQLFQCSSASRKFLNVDRFILHSSRLPVFQCSSASRKFLNATKCGCNIAVISRFSALQRAENSSMSDVPASAALLNEFQCSSASRKFLNHRRRPLERTGGRGFSALQRAENSSIARTVRGGNCGAAVSVLFSEPKIPQCVSAPNGSPTHPRVSVLFSEPKIPQSLRYFNCWQRGTSFSALQRAENSSIAMHATAPYKLPRVSVLFSEPKIPQSPERSTPRLLVIRFQCSSASRKFLNRSLPHLVALAEAFQCSSASRKFLNQAACWSASPRMSGFSALQRAENSSILRRTLPARCTARRFSALQRAENSSML